MSSTIKCRGVEDESEISTRRCPTLVVVAITSSVVLLEFSMRSRLHLQAGANMRHQVRATTAADTALVLTRACLDPEAWAL